MGMEDWVLEEVGHGEMRGSSAQKTFPGLETTYETIKSWAEEHRLSSLFGPRDFCLVGGNFAHCQQQVPKNVFIGLPLPLAP